MLGEIIAAFFIALLLSGILIALLGWRHPAQPGETARWPAAAFVFFVLFFVIWAAGVWLTPAGPLVWGVAWIPLVIVGVIVALLVLAAAGPGRHPHTAAEEQAQEAEVAAAISSFGAFFWLLLFVLLIAIAVGLLL
jgi:hypothetical protein